MATMGAEIKSPKRVLPWVIVGTMVVVVFLYAFVGWAVLSSLGVDTLAASVTPVADLVGDSWRPLVAIVAALAALGSLMTILAGMSRTALAMAEGRDLPLWLGFVWPKTKTPVLAEITMAVIGIAVVLWIDPVWLVGASSGAVLSYYALAHLSALRQPASERFVPRVVQVVGVVGCVVLVVALPIASVVTSAVLVTVSVLVWWGLVRPRRALG
jgi:APA family basic amino acid/polyamine antiporter